MTDRSLALALDRSGSRLDRLLAEAWPDLSRSRIQDLMRQGHVRLDEVEARDPSGRAPPAGTVTLTEPPASEPERLPERIPLAIVHEDEELIVIDKPAGLVAHEGAGHKTGTLVNALLAHCGDTLSGIGGVKRPGIVHRLDKDTSGLLVVAKTDRAHRHLAAQFADHGRTGELRRAYLAFVWGAPSPVRGAVRGALARASHHREKMTVVADDKGRHAVTHYEVEETFRQEESGPVASLVRCALETGRTHQIRVHMAHLRHPLIGDPLYGPGFRTKAERLPEPARTTVAGLGRQALHAAVLQFRHPGSDVVLRFESGLPPDLQGLRDALGT